MAITDYMKARRLYGKVRRQEKPGDREAVLGAAWQEMKEEGGSLASFRHVCFLAGTRAYRASDPVSGRQIFEFAWSLAPVDMETGDPDDYALLHHPDVQVFTKKIATEKNLVYVTGCARSGTTLILRCMGTAANPFYIGKESALSVLYIHQPVEGENVILKRRAETYQYFNLIPPEVLIINIVRDPYYVLTSHHKNRPGELYVPLDRWVKEYQAYRAFRDAHPGKNFLNVRYEELLAEPDAVQSRIGNAFGIEFVMPFSRHHERTEDPELKVGGRNRKWDAIEPNRQIKHRSDREMNGCLGKIDEKTSQEIKTFCDEFGYDSERMKSLFQVV